MSTKLLAGVGAVAVSAAFAVPALAATKSVKIGDNYFVTKANKSTVTVKRGTTVRWNWTGKFPHNVKATGAAKFSSGKPKRSGRYSKKVTKTGSYRIICVVHDNMKMTLKVRR